MAVKLREKSLSNGQVSLYLDILHNRIRSYEFLNIRINKKKPTKEDSEKRRLAEDLRAKKELELILNENGLIDKKKRQSDFIQFFKDFVKGKRHNNLQTATLYQLIQFAGNRPLPISAVTASWLKEWEKHMLKTVSNNTALCYLKMVTSVLNELVRQNIIPRNPWHNIPMQDRLKKKDVIRTAWTIEQLQLLVDTPCDIDPQFKQVYLFACFTGLRWSDANGLKWSNIVQKQINNVEEWFLYFEQQKTEAIEYLPLSDQAIEILKQRKADVQGSDEYIFPKAKETNRKNNLVHRRVDLSIKKWAKKAGLNWKKMKFHTGRHTFATNLLESTNGDLYTVSKLLGHKSIKTTQIYAHVRDNRKHAAVKALPKLSFTSTVSSQNESSPLLK
jgi:integrase